MFGYSSSNSVVRLIGFLLLCGLLIGSVCAGNDYQWGEIGANDYKLAKDSVSKAFFVGLVQSKKYVFKQSVCIARVPFRFPISPTLWFYRFHRIIWTP